MQGRKKGHIWILLLSLVFSIRPAWLTSMSGRVRCLVDRRPSARVARIFHARDAATYLHRYVQTWGLATRTEPYRDPISGSADKTSGGWMAYIPNLLQLYGTHANDSTRGGNLDATVELDLAVDASAAVELRLETVRLDRLALRERTQCQGEGEDRGGEDETFAYGSDGVRPGGGGGSPHRC